MNLLSHFAFSGLFRKSGKIFGKNCKKMLTIASGSDNINELSQDRASDQQKSFLEKKKVVDKAEQM